MSRQIFSFSSIKYSSGDLLFYYNKSGDEGVKDANSTNENEPEMREAITAASVVEDEEFRQIYHCAMVVGGGEGDEQQKKQLVHASDHGVVVQTFGETVLALKPHFVELCHVQLEDSWKREALKWAMGELGSEYNDQYSPECVNSQGKRAFYCSQLVVEAYKQTSKAGTNPFLSHELNFLGSDGKMLPYWVDYYRQLCPQNPEPPQGQPGSHPSKLRASPNVHCLARKYFEK